ncbi:MAG: DUF402 domain-containing protein [Blastocatellia bacterium]|nr:DUF402 domain-containing protein [Blastocatellia bacterium]
MNSFAVTVEALNFDLSLRKSWPARLLKSRGGRIELLGEFDRDINHPELGIIRRGTRSREFFFTDRWYNIFEFTEALGEPLIFYCNIAMPPTFEDSILRYVDLDIDVSVAPDGTAKVLDLDEFYENAERFSYSEELKHRAEVALQELLELIERRSEVFQFLPAVTKVEF